MIRVFSPSTVPHPWLEALAIISLQLSTIVVVVVLSSLL